ncbi:MAG TPA: SWIM zinc finger family protein, partial [Bradyrhizobium sp.]|nr:SWIM zinc finger family protein [Bradyrhizobium sp.]
MSQGFASMDVELVLSDLLKRKDIYTFFSGSAFDKAVAYQAEGRVAELEISEDLSHLSATVRGSGSNIYRVDIQLVFSQGRLADLDGECSCPMAENCKHVAATVLQALNGKPPSTSGPADKRGAAATPAAALSYEVTAWLDIVGKVLRGNDYPADQPQRLLYCLHSSQDGERMPDLAVSLVSVRVLKGGEFGAQVSQPNLGEFSPERAAKYYRDVDIEILTKLTSRRRAYGYYASERLQSAELLQQIIATGRSFWNDHERPPLRWGEQREGRIEWQGGKKTVVPRLIVPGMTAFNAQPPVYLDEIAGVMGRVELNLPPRLAHQILSAPPLPRAQLAEVATRLGQKIPVIHHDVLPAPPAAAVKITEAPVPILRLKLGRAAAYASWYRDAATVMPVAHLSFRYGPLEVDSTESRIRLEVFQNGQVYTLSRRRALESSKFERLHAIGFVNARSVYSYLEGGHFEMTFKSAPSWLDFLNHRAAELQAEGFEIRIDDDFPYRPAIPAGAFDAEFEGSGIDWFELALGVEIDGERRDLAPMLAALVSNPGFTPDMVRKLAEDGD